MTSLRIKREYDEECLVTNIKSEIDIKDEPIESEDENSWDDEMKKNLASVKEEDKVEDEEMHEENNASKEKNSTAIADTTQDGVTGTGDSEEDTEIEQSTSRTRNPRKGKTAASSKVVQKRNKKSKEGNDQGNDAFALLKNLAGKGRPRPRDEYTLYGEQIAMKLKKFDEVTRAETQHKINCIMHEAEMKTLQQ